MEKKRLYICFSPLHIAMAILHKQMYESGNNNLDQTATGIMLTDNIPEYQKICSSLEQLGLFQDVFQAEYHNANSVVHNKMKYPWNIFSHKNIILNWGFVQNWAKEGKTYFSDTDIYLYLDNNIIGHFFIYLSRQSSLCLSLMEDGELVYVCRRFTLFDFIKKYLAKIPIGGGRDPEIKKVIVQNPERLPGYLSAKAESFDFVRGFNEETEHIKSALYSLFLKDNKINIYDNCALIITQPLSEDGLITEDKKIALYEKIARLYCQGMTIIIKAHPREKTDYERVSNGKWHTLPKDIPLELIFLLGKKIHFKCAVTIFSSALKKIKIADKHTFLGMEWDEELSLAARKKWKFLQR